MSCMSPMAPAGDTASGLKSDSTFIMHLMRSGSTSCRVESRSMSPSNLLVTERLTVRPLPEPPSFLL